MPRDHPSGDDLEALRAENTVLRAQVAALKEARDEPGEALVLESATAFAILTTDLEGRVTGWNEGARRLFGWSEAEAVGEDARMIFTPEDREAGAPEAEMDDASAQGRAVDERWHLHKDGSRRWVSGLMMPLNGPGGGTRGFLKIVRDRTEQLHAGRNRIRRLEQMKALADAARSVMGARDLPTTLQAITDAARTIIGAHLAVCSLTRGPDWSQAINAVSLSEAYAPWRSYAGVTDGSGIYAWVCEGNRTVRLTQAEIEAHPRWRGFGGQAGAHPPMRGWLASALVGADGRNLGLIQLSDKMEGDFDDADEAIVIQLAQCAASAIERTQAEAALSESERRLRLAIEAGRMAVWELDLATDTVTSSPELNRLLGFPLDATPTAEELRAHYYPGERERLQALGRELVARGERFAEVEYRYVGPDGRHRWLMLRAEIHRDDAGRPSRYVGVVLDVSERKAAEIALHESRLEAEREAARTSAILAQLAEGVVVTDAAGRIVFVNEAAARLHGVSSLHVAPEAYAESYHLFTDDGLPYPSDSLPLARAVRGETVEDALWRIRRPGGPEVIAVGSARPIVTPEGERVGAVLTLRDETARIAAQDGLRRLNATLEAGIVERTGDLARAEAALRQAQKMEAIGQLTGGVAHDFNNLLTIIRSSTDFLRRRDLPEDRRRRYVDAISDTVDRASKLTGQLLAFARRQALKPEVFDVSARLGGIDDMVRTIVGGRIRIATDAACERCFAEADVTQFDTALVNMAVNARDAMDGEGTLTIGIRAVEEMPALRGHAGGPGAFVAVSVTDTGAGIAPDKLPHIFEPFFTTKEVGKGTGLGLSQVYGFAKQSGGDVAVESRVGEGTTFILYLPRVETAPAPEASGPAADAPEAGRGRRVLVVEDNVDVGRFSTQLLEDLGYETTWAANADEALRLLAAAPDGFDVVFTDVVMPGMSGVELGQEIRRRHPDLPVILTSGYSHVLAEEGRHGFELVQKPYAVEELSRVLRRIASRRPR
ncbi:PAS domain S-box protein [Salinarimonas soli]|uniref:histidine kinase n=1 Tax=Salinarimonas soli TaxID=1638099 RepID=A0A5B2VAZ1_9HYPH|nr:PAS domain S-box protein [Salinarimonas soli]KAA2236693.1 PAS domain S-box protein [Salinarimonas soli]